MSEQELIFSLIFFLGTFVHSALGYGFPLVTTPLISVFFDLRSAILITLFPTLLNNMTNILYGGPFFYLAKQFFPLIAAGIVGSSLGGIVIIYFNPIPFKFLLAFSILLYLYIQKKKSRGEEIRLDWINQGPLSMLIFGLLGGLMGGTVNVALAVFIIYLSNLSLKNTEIIKMLNLCFITGKMAQIIVFYYNDYLTNDFFMTLLKVTWACIPGFYLGFIVRKKIDEKLFKRILNLTLLGLSILLLYQTWIFLLEKIR